LTLDPGWVKNQDPDHGFGSGMNIFRTYFRELRNNFLGLKYFNSLMRMRIRESC
jgi:hypothetical protein